MNEQLSKGKTSFAIYTVKNDFPELSSTAIKRSLDRLSAKGRVLSIYKGYYLIIPPQYLSKGVLPPALFIDALMKFTGRRYYVGLLNAAAFYGASHQQPQEYYVFTTFPVLRPTVKKNIKINYISRKEIPEVLLEKRKTEAGYITVSSLELTAADLVQFEKRIGGLNRAATVLNELAEAIVPTKINEHFFKEIPAATIQRLGYLMDKVLGQHAIGDYLFEQSQASGVKFFRTPLKTSSAIKGFFADEKWKVIVNTEIEFDE